MTRNSSLDDPTSGTMADVGRLTSPILVGRDEELARLRSAWEAAGQGEPSLVLVGGDAGVGKTRLTDELLHHVRDGEGRVLVGACIEVGDGSVAFAALTDALRGLAADEDASRLPELLGPARPQLARLVPSLGGAEAFDGDPPSPIVVLQAALDGLARLAEDRPVVFVLEDIHWADRSTLDLLAYLARTVREERLLIIATYRTDEIHRRHQLRPFLAELSRARAIERIDLAPFDREQLTAQLRAIRDENLPAHLIDEVLRRSDGNPFLAEELLAAYDEEGPHTLSASLRDILDARIADLPPASRRVLEVAATIGRTAHHELLTAVGSDVTEDLREGLRAAVDHQILVPEPDGLYRFRHALVQEAVHDELLPGDRIQLHRAVAEVLQGRPELASGGPEYVDAELAHHWEQAGDRVSAYQESI
ncbi:MAG: AAA family ATPase, partial [Nitriliruptorales bacterium]|nr:AAA family ATPase [Nitriliruptorales bacterium]